MTNSSYGNKLFTELAEAATIFSKYTTGYAGTHCEHDVLMVAGIEPDDVSDDDKARLDELGFFVGDEYGDEMFMSFRFGSA